MRTMLYLPVLALACLAGTSHAQQRHVDLEQRLTPAQLAEVGLTPAQLALLNRYLREADNAQPPVETARYETPAGAPREDPGALVGFNDAPIRSRLRGSVSAWEPGTVFVLENGQQWKVLKGNMTLRKPLEAPEILVVPGIAGRWFLQVHEDMPKARVYRID